MKIRHIVLVVATVVAGKTLASSVELSGVVDVSIRYDSNADGKGSHATYMADGQLDNSAVAIKVTEDVQKGLQAVAHLEVGFSAADGSQNGLANRNNATGVKRFFNRAANVGLKGDFGTVLLGRQATILNKTIGMVDPTNIYNTTGHYSSKPVTPPGHYFSSYADRTISYAGNWDTPVTLLGSYSFGGVPGAQSQGSSWAVGLAYADDFARGKVKAIAAFSRDTGGGNPVAECTPSITVTDVPSLPATFDVKGCGLYGGWRYASANAKKQHVSTIALGLSFEVNAIKVSGGGIYKQESELGLIDDSTKTGKDRRYTIFGGLTYAVTPDFDVTGAYYHDKYDPRGTGCSSKTYCKYAGGSVSKDGTTLVKNLDGKSDVMVLMLAYKVSKRTTAYLTYDYTHLKNMPATSDSSATMANGLQMEYLSTAKAASDNTKPVKNTRSGISVGMQHRF